MSSETITVAKRTAIGSNASKRLRAQGQVPAILYGHGEENVNLSVRADALQGVIKHGTKLLTLTGDIADMAVLRQVQWDTYGTSVVHVDLHRVSATEAVEVTLPVHLHGEAPGIGEGGQLVFQTHELTIRCPAANIPEFITVSVSGLHLGKSIHAGEVTLPEGASMVTGSSRVVVQIVKPSENADDLAAAGAVEPELIRKEKAEKGKEAEAK
ncbi:MAG: 50S ribosomal protein L25 [Pirellulaceae bacterium]|nr:50S ribosomal protein L25 [Pirellulaceae bacterium]